jgi:hypothetical protein
MNKTSTSLETIAKTWLRNNLHRVLGKNIREYRHIWVTNRLGVNSLGLTVDLNPGEGTVIEVNDEFSCIKTSPKTFMLIDNNILREPLVVNSKVVLTPYQRRRFDGTTFRQPESSVMENGVRINSYVIGQTASTIPVQPAKSSVGGDVLKHLHDLRCPDGTRVISNMLVDLNATNLKFDDPYPHGDVKFQFFCSSMKFKGNVTIGLASGQDWYYVELYDSTSTELIQRVEFIDSTSLASVLTDLLDDGQWRYAKVEIVKPAPRKRTTALAN